MIVNVNVLTRTLIILRQFTSFTNKEQKNLIKSVTLSVIFIYTIKRLNIQNH